MKDYLYELPICNTLAVWVTIIDSEAWHVTAFTFIYGFVTLEKKKKNELTPVDQKLISLCCYYDRDVIKKKCLSAE